MRGEIGQRDMQLLEELLEFEADSLASVLTIVHL